MAFLDTVTSGSSFVPESGITTILREDLLPLVTIVDPSETPIIARMKRMTADSPIFQWITDSLPALVTNDDTGTVEVDGINVQGISEGFEPAFTTGYPHTGAPTRQTNFVQMWAARVRVSDTLKLGKPTGIRDPYNHDMMKSLKAIGKAIERRFFDNASANATYAAGAATDPRRAKGLFEWATATPALNQVTVGGVLTPETIDSCMEAVVKAGGRPDTVACGVGSKFDLSLKLRTDYSGSGTTVVNTSNIAAMEHRIVRNVDFYDGDGGPLRIVMSWQIPESSSPTGGGKAWLLEMAKLGYATYEPVHHIPLAKTGHNTKGIIVGQGTYMVANASAMGVINNVTT